MISNTHSNILICSPAETQLAGVCERWVKELSPEEHDPVPMEKLLRDKSASLIVFFGSELLNHVIREPRLSSLLKEKVIYHIGGTDDLNISNIDSIGMQAYFGYKGTPAYVTNIKEEVLFRDALFAGLRSLSRQETLDTALEITRKAWSELIHLKTESRYDLFIQMYARYALQQLILIGDKEWKIPDSARFIRIKSSLIRAHRPRIEVVNLTPVLLKWLQESPERIAQLSPEQFEDLIAERLTNAGLNVTKTGKTNTPDGGIDLIAHPKSSSIPYLLAAQIKHSRVNRPVSASVVRDFRGAITSLPIDIGMIVTNTSFTPNAQWTARQLPRLIRLRNIEDLKLWLADEIDESSVLKDIPSAIEVAPGLVIPIPWSIE